MTLETKTIGIVRQSCIEEHEVHVDGFLKILVGMENSGRKRKERNAVARAFRDNGLDVFCTSTAWPHDEYISRNGLYVPKKEFGDIAQGGNYVFGDGFVIVSEHISERLEALINSSDGFRRFFDGLDRYYLPSYWGLWKRGQGVIIRAPSHVDLFAGYVPKKRVVTIERGHFEYEDIAREIERLMKEKGVSLMIIDDTTGTFLCNYYVVHGDSPLVVANSHNGFYNEIKGKEVRVAAPKIPVTVNPTNLGSIKCMVNQAESERVFELLGIHYQRWGVRQEAGMPAYLSQPPEQPHSMARQFK